MAGSVVVTPLVVLVGPWVVVVVTIIGVLGAVGGASIVVVVAIGTEQDAATRAVRIRKTVRFMLSKTLCDKASFPRGRAQLRYRYE